MKTTLLDNKVEDRIRKAHRRGQKKISIEGRWFNIKKVTKKVTYNAGGKSHKRREHWLLITPVNSPTGLPMAQIELKPMGNLRSDRGSA